MSEFVLRVLNKWFGRERTLSIVWFLRERAILMICGIVFVFAFAGVLVSCEPDPSEHVAFHLAEVKGILTVPTENVQQRAILDAKLPNGQDVRLYERANRLTGLLHDVCIQERRGLRTGRQYLRVVASTNCETS